MKVSDFVIEYFERNKIETCFTISGGGCIHLINSLRKSNMNVFCPHHEQTMLMASEGYYRQSGKLSLNVVTTGPGGTNTMTGLLGLWTDSIPSIIISGQVPLNQISKGEVQTNKWRTWVTLIDVWINIIVIDIFLKL